jgi:hypothetical protein
VSVDVVTAQNEPKDFGEVSIEELKMNQYDPDTTARAVMLFNKGVVKLDRNSMVGTVFKRSMRVKILDKRAADEWGHFEFEIPKEAMLKVEGVTYNLVNGKPVPSKLSGDDIYRTKKGKDSQTITFALPNVQNGSVLEVSWTWQLRDYYLPSWQFQQSIPTLRSEYIIYGLFTLKPHLTGVIKPKHHVTKYDNTYNEWVMTDIPAFRQEPQMPDQTVYLSMVKFVTDTEWKNVVGSMLSHPSFYGVIERNEFLREVALSLADRRQGDQIIEAISNYIKANVSWNGVNDYLAYQPEDVLKKKTGTAADINLLFASMLKKAGMNVEPVLISTRDHGFIEEELPTINQFN